MKSYTTNSYSVKKLASPPITIVFFQSLDKKKLHSDIGVGSDIAIDVSVVIVIVWKLVR